MVAWGGGDGSGAAQTARVTAQAALPLPRPTSERSKRAVTRVAVGALAACALVVGGVALRSVATSDGDTTLTVAQLDDSLGITAAGSRELDTAPAAALQAALDREAGDFAALHATGVRIGSEQRFGVVFTAPDRATADRLTALLDRTTRFTVALTAPTSADPHWTVGGITPAARVAVPLAHQLTERMTEAAWRAGGATFSGWRILGR